MGVIPFGNFALFANLMAMFHSESREIASWLMRVLLLGLAEDEIHVSWGIEVWRGFWMGITRRFFAFGPFGRCSRWRFPILSGPLRKLRMEKQFAPANCEYLVCHVCRSKNGYTKGAFLSLDGTWGYEALDFGLPAFEHPPNWLKRGIDGCKYRKQNSNEFKHRKWGKSTNKYGDGNQIQFTNECGWLTMTYGRSISTRSPSVILRLRPTGCFVIGFFHSSWSNRWNSPSFRKIVFSWSNPIFWFFQALASQPLPSGKLW